METRDVLLKADKVAVVFERLADGKIRVTTSSWDDAEIIFPSQALEVDDKLLGRCGEHFPSQALEVAVVGKQAGLVRVDKPIVYLGIDDTGIGRGLLRSGNELM